MDPTENLRRQLIIAARMLKGHKAPGDADQLALLVESLDGWITRGGFLPAQWQAAMRRTVLAPKGGR
jgi:hypothetical protein